MIGARFLLALFSIVLITSVPASAADPQTKNAKANRLLKAASPYLRQHAYNPVDWYVWGPEAFEKAKREGKPIFLSVGYATCYWCHVMARESFESVEVAQLLNAHTIPVKVDRERRPDVDATYMLATELITQQGGWPNSVMLTPDLKPFYGFGYVKPDRFKEIIQQVAAGWKDQRDVILKDAGRIADLIARATNRQADNVAITKTLLRRATLHALSGFDVFNGGLGTAPKFPQENVIQFLLHRAEQDNDKVALEAALLTLDHIVWGGIRDHLAGGFHRYATDNAWAVPHFEKMLYNQALMVRALLKAYQLTGRRRYSEAARSTLDFVIEQMTTEEGGFASAFDAETDGREGIYYLWSAVGFRAVLGTDAAFGEAIFGVTDAGNHEGLNTLKLVAPRADLAAAQKMTRAEFDRRFETIVKKLAAARAKRKPIKRDDKVLAGWNALMVRALAEASVVLDDPKYLAAGVRAQAILNGKLGGSTGELKRSYYEGVATVDAHQSDYAFVGLSALALFDATGEQRWLDSAELLAKKMFERFADKKGGGLFLTRNKTGFTRTKDTDDRTVPSGNAAALELFARLRQRTKNVVWRQRVLAQQAAVSGVAASDPVGHAATLVNADIATRGETGAHQAAAYGAMRLVADRLSDGATGRIRIKLKPGWHINSTRPLQDFLIPTKVRLESAGTAQIEFPNPVERKLGFHSEPLSLYEGNVDIRVKLPKGLATNEAHKITLNLQACSDSICLEPQVVRLLLPAKQ